MTIQELWKLALHLDWHNKDPKQAENAWRLIDHLGKDREVATIDTATVDKLVHWLRSKGPSGRGCSDSTVRRYLSALRILLKRAERMGEIDRLPLMPETRSFKKDEPRDLVIEPDWFEHLLIGVDGEETRQILRFLWATGCRVSEALNLTWDRVTPEYVQFVGTKDKKPRRLPMTEEIRAALPGEAMPKEGRIWSLDYDQIKYRFTKGKKRACSWLGLSDRVKKEWTIHTLRHTKLTRLAREGMSATALQKWAGHGSLQMTQRYIHVGLSDLTEWCRAKGQL